MTWPDAQETNRRSDGWHWIAVGAVVGVFAMAGCGGGGSTSMVNTSSDPVASAVAATKQVASGIVPRATSRQCTESLAALKTAVEVLMAQSGTAPASLRAVLDATTLGLSDGAALDTSDNTLTVTEFAITYELRYDPATGEVTAVTTAPVAQAGPGCP